jgi:hypothetical protein
MVAKSKRKKEGQALIEMIFILPLIITLIIWLLQGVEVMRSSAEHQKYLRLSLFLRLNNYAKYNVDAIGPDAGSAPEDSIVEANALYLEYDRNFSQKKLATTLDAFEKRTGSPVFVKSKYGICIRPDC